MLELRDLHERPKDETTHGSTRMEEPSQAYFFPYILDEGGGDRSFEKSFVEKIYHFVSKMRSKGIAFFLIGENTNSGPAGMPFFNLSFLVKCIQPIDFYFLG